MSNSTIKAKEIINLIEQGESIESVKIKIGGDENLWGNYSSKAYNISLEKAKKERTKDEFKSHVSVTSNNEISEILRINEVLANYALTLPVYITIPEFIKISTLELNHPKNESKIIQEIGKITMNPKIRVLQKKGRIDKIEYFKIFSKIVDAAVLSYYRTNFVSCYLTLLPIIEGVIIRWMGYNEVDKKPEFEKIRKFFKNSSSRQPYPSNIQFHNIFTKACDKILNEHFYKPTTRGNSYSNFNRHVASHLLSDNQFATKENCIRLFILLDNMTEIYIYESRKKDPRFNLTSEEISADINILTGMLSESKKRTFEKIFLGE